MPAEKISIAEAKENKLFYFVVTAIIYRESDGRCLVLKRHERETAHPGKYGVVGGKLEWEDLDLARPTRVNGNVLDFDNALEALVAREAKEESGVIIDQQDLRYVDSLVFVRPDGIPVVLIKFGARYVSGEVVPEAGAFTEYKWVTVEEAEKLDCIEGISGEIAHTIELFK